MSGISRNENSWMDERLFPVKAMVTKFSRVVNYGKYRLLNIQGSLEMRKSLGMYHHKQQIDRLHPSLDDFDGDVPISLLSFLAILRDTLDTLGTSEAASVRVLAYLLEEEAKDVHAEQISLSSSAMMSTL